MKDEIKRKIKGYVYNEDDEKKILDYITNLQEQLHKASLDIQELTERDLMCPTSCDKLINLQEENNHLKQNKKRTLEYIENNRIREKCIVDINTLEGLLNE